MKSKSRVTGYKPGTADRDAEYDMLLPDGVTCKDCIWAKKCTTIFGSKETDTRCQFHPSRFQQRNQSQEGMFPHLNS
jgi:hypothetical protein